MAGEQATASQPPPLMPPRRAPGVCCRILRQRKAIIRETSRRAAESCRAQRGEELRGVAAQEAVRVYAEAEAAAAAAFS